MAISERMRRRHNRVVTKRAFMRQWHADVEKLKDEARKRGRARKQSRAIKVAAKRLVKNALRSYKKGYAAQAETGKIIKSPLELNAEEVGEIAVAAIGSDFEVSVVTFRSRDTYRPCVTGYGLKISHPHP